MSKKTRADELVHARGHAESRTKAQALILAGKVSLKVERKSGLQEWEVIKKPGQALPADAELLVEDTQKQYVGRGALKLRKAFEHWGLSAEGKLALDVGASTGGFTQVLLENGARRVLALDVGKNQLHERLRADPRVVSVEGQHVLRVTPELWEKVGVVPPFDMAVTDVSFISLTKIISAVAEWLRPGAEWVMLVKPQFEVGPRKAPGGIVKDPAFRKEALDAVRSCVEGDGRLEWISETESPIEGGDGNKEYLALVRRKAAALALLVMAAIGVSSCASGPRSAAGPGVAPPTTEAPAEPVETPAEVGSQELGEDPQPEGQLPANEFVSQAFGVWIDGAGLDAFAALGFLQELEKAGRKPSRVAGTGFGCWIALAWAIENNGNRAEWQAFKWSDWSHLPKAGLLGRLTAGAARKALEQQAARLLPAKSWDAFALPADCPSFDSASPSRFISGRGRVPSQAVAFQFQVPALGAVAAPEGDTEWPGLAGGTPRATDFDALSGTEGSWIVLRTRTAADRSGPGAWAAAMASRPEVAGTASGTTPEGRRFRFVDLADASSRPTADVSHFDKRRRWLLEGRRRASKALKDGALDDSPATP